MNFLAHAYLSFENPGILTGNMISDFVKGKQKDKFPILIREGIMLHRQIDAFTDEHPVTAEAKSFFRPAYRLYSGAFVDVAFDHFLAIDKTEFPDDQLSSFALEVYRELASANEWLPPAFASLLPYMTSQNWLFNYGTKEGIFKSFAGVVRRAAYLNDSLPANEIFEEYYQPLGDCYRQFWPALKKFTQERFDEIMTKI